VERIRFASALDGWTFGPGLYATHDGATTWQAVSLHGAVLDLEAADGQVFALVGSCLPPAPGCGSPQVALWRAPVGSDQWAPIPGVTGTLQGGVESSIFLHGATGWVLLMNPTNGDQAVFVHDGGTWNRTTSPCPTGTTLESIASAAATVGFLCVGQGAAGSTAKQLLTSTDGGRTTRLAGTPPSAGDGGTLAAPGTSQWALATASGASFIDRSTDSGHTWRGVVTFDDGGAGFGDFGFTTPTQGVAIHGPFTDTPQLLLSRDAGATWNTVRF